MFSRVPERKMRLVRALLLLGWLLLIASLFWDPFSAALTDPTNTASPFRIEEPTAVLRGEVIPVEPYAMGNRIFWTMIVPLLPVFLMVFGHEAWRRICPLSFASQLPRYLGWQRHRQIVQRGTGMPERLRYLVARDGWLQRNAWYLQGALLFAGLTARLLILNSDRLALAVTLLGVIAAAITVGWLWNGKTWCNYFCPVNVVQRIYTEPRGLLESTPHVTRSATPQSMCRTPTPSGDKSACVGCTLHCGDVDLEKSYWETITQPARRNIYYMFPGLIFGFYGFYYLYSGTWDYYFSGLWTHEAGMASRILSSGMLIAGHAVPVPKLLAAPLFLGLCVAATLGLGRLLEAAYRRFRNRRGKVPEAEIINHCLSVTAWLSFNSFYLFGGRPNLLLLPSAALHAVDVLIIAVSTMWLWQAIARTPFKYRRENLAMSLLEQLRRMKVDVARYFEGRSLEELRPDEVYVFSKVLPAFSKEQKLSAYKNLLEDAIATGKTNSAQFLEVLAELRQEMQVSEEEHARLLEELGVAGDTNFDARQATAYEKALCIQNYGELVGTAIADQVALGRTVVAAVQTKELQAAIRILRASLQISDSDHQGMLEWLSGPDGILAQRVETGLAELRDLAAAKFCLQALNADDGFWTTLEALLVQRLDIRVAATLRQLLGFVHATEDSGRAAGYAGSIARLDAAACQVLLGQPVSGTAGPTWQDCLAPGVLAILDGREPGPAAPGPDAAAMPGYAYRDVIRAGHDLDRCMRILAQDEAPVAMALALTAFAHLDLEKARAYAAELLGRDAPIDHWLIAEVAEALTGLGDRPETRSSKGRLRVTIGMPGAAMREQSFADASVSVGSALGNDIILAWPGIAPYHLSLQHDGGDIRVMQLDTAPLRIDGRPCEAASVIVTSGARLSFTEGPDDGPTLLLQATDGGKPYRTQPSDTVTRLVWLSDSALCRGLELSALMDIAARAELRRYAAGSYVFHRGDAAEETIILRTGELAETDAASPTGSGRTEWAAEAGGQRPASAQVVSDFAVILAVAGDAAPAQRPKGEVAPPVPVAAARQPRREELTETVE